MAYGYRRTITIDPTKAGTVDSTNFPMLISGTYSYLATVANGGLVTNANGYDIKFTSDSAGNTLLNWEIETYVATSGAINFWVKIPTLSASVNTVIYMFYGDATVSTFQGGAAGTTWDSNYAMVYHLPNGTVLGALDSTANAFNGTISGPTATTGQVDGAGVWGAVSTDKITTGLTANGALRTYEVWMYRTGPGGLGSGRIFDKRVAGAQVEVLLVSDGSNIIEFDRTFSGGSASWAVAKPTDNVFHHLVVTYDSSLASNDPIFYIDGVVTTLSVDTNSTGTVTDNADAYVLGNRGSDNARNWAGRLDEFRVSNVIRNQSYVTASFNSQSAPVSFYAVGTQVVPSTGGTTSMQKNQISNSVSI